MQMMRSSYQLKDNLMRKFIAQIRGTNAKINWIDFIVNYIIIGDFSYSHTHSHSHVCLCCVRRRIFHFSSLIR